jgi:hypothetical protein
MITIKGVVNSDKYYAQGDSLKVLYEAIEYVNSFEEYPSCVLTIEDDSMKGCILELTRDGYSWSVDVIHFLNKRSIK